MFVPPTRRTEGASSPSRPVLTISGLLESGLRSERSVKKRFDRITGILRFQQIHELVLALLIQSEPFHKLLILAIARQSVYRSLQRLDGNRFKHLPTRRLFNKFLHEQQVFHRSLQQPLHRRLSFQRRVRLSEPFVLIFLTRKQRG